MRTAMKDTATGAGPRAFAVAYTVEGPWDVERIKEDLFDVVGAITPLATGFTCTPDEFHTAVPQIMVDAVARTVRFVLLGPYREDQAAGPILRAAHDFATRYGVDLEPLSFERWQLQPGRQGYTLLESLPLGAHIHRDGAPVGHA